MQINSLVLLIALSTLSGCFSSDQSRPVIVVDKSINQHNIESTRLGETRTDKKTKNNKTSKHVPRSKSWSIPVKAKVLKKFSQQHPGIAFNTQAKQPIRSIRDGKVVYIGDKMKSHGQMIIVKHPLGFYSVYTQTQSQQIKLGDTVIKGQLIAKTTQKHFYFEMKKFETPINPLNYLK